MILFYDILWDAILEDIQYFFQIEAGPSPYVAESVSNRELVKQTDSLTIASI